MAHRVYLKNLSFGVQKGPLLRTLHSYGINIPTFDEILIVRKGQGAGQHKECSAFVTLQSNGEVEAAVASLDGRVLKGCSSRPLEGEKAVPRITTLTETARQDPYQVAGEDPTSDNTSAEPSSDSRGAAALHDMLKVKQDHREERQSCDLKTSSHGAKTIQQFVKQQKEQQESQNEKPWHRRKRLWGEND